MEESFQIGKRKSYSAFTEWAVDMIGCLDRRELAVMLSVDGRCRVRIESAEGRLYGVE